MKILVIILCFTVIGSCSDFSSLNSEEVQELKDIQEKIKNLNDREKKIEDRKKEIEKILENDKNLSDEERKRLQEEQDRLKEERDRLQKEQETQRRLQEEQERQKKQEKLTFCSHCEKQFNCYKNYYSNMNNCYLDCRNTKDQSSVLNCRSNCSTNHINLLNSCTNEDLSICGSFMLRERSNFSDSEIRINARINSEHIECIQSCDAGSDDYYGCAYSCHISFSDKQYSLFCE